MSLFGNGNGAGRHEVHEIHPEPINFDARPASERAQYKKDLDKFLSYPTIKNPIKLNTLDEIARLLRTAEYGEMMDLAEALQKLMEAEGSEQPSIAKILHKWATSRV